MNKKYSIKEIDPKLIALNPSNVRDETEEEIEADENFQRLKDSIYEFGVLVPLVVKPLKKGKKKYILIDGERRYRASIATNQDTVPVHIVKASEADDEVLYAFQIHTLRKEWSRTAQARALHTILKNTRKEIGSKSEKVLFEAVQEKTGYSDTKLRDLFRVLRYTKINKSILEEIDSPKSKVRFSHLVQLEASFVEQVERLFPDIIKQYGVASVRSKLLKKVESQVIGSTREPMEKLLPLFMQAKSKDQAKYLQKLIKAFLDNKNKSPEDIYRSFELKFPTDKEDLVRLSNEAGKKIEELQSIFSNLGFTQLRAYKPLKAKLNKKIDLLLGILKVVKKQIK